MSQFGLVTTSESPGEAVLSPSDNTVSTVGDAVDALVKGPSFLTLEQLKKIQVIDGWKIEPEVKIGNTSIHRKGLLADRFLGKLSSENWKEIFDVLGLETEIDDREKGEVHISMNSKDMEKFDEFIKFYFGEDMSKPIIGGYNVTTRIAQRDGQRYGLRYCF